jgi:hypothetical protein
MSAMLNFRRKEPIQSPSEGDTFDPDKVIDYGLFYGRLFAVGRKVAQQLMTEISTFFHEGLSLRILWACQQDG